MPPAIETQALSKRFGPVLAVDGQDALELHVEAAALEDLLGRVGA